MDTSSYKSLYFVHPSLDAFVCRNAGKVYTAAVLTSCKNAKQAHPTRLALPGQRDYAVTIKNAKIFFLLAENQMQCPASVLSFEQA